MEGCGMRTHKVVLTQTRYRGKFYVGYNLAEKACVRYLSEEAQSDFKSSNTQKALQDARVRVDPKHPVRVEIPLSLMTQYSPTTRWDGNWIVSSVPFHAPISSR